MQHILFITIGTRDLQLPPQVQIEVQLFEHFEAGNVDTGKNHVVKRNDFLRHTQAILEAYDQLKDRVVFPMVEKSIELAGENIQEIVLISTCQDPNDVQDTYFLGQFIQRRLHEKGFVVHEQPIIFPPIDFEQLVEFFTNLYERFIGYQIFFGNSGGTPDMRAASHFAGMFRNIQFITLQARTGQANMRNFDRQERLVLLHTIEKMLENFDYAGITQLPLSNNIISKYAEYALARMSLDFERANDIARQLDIADWIVPENPKVNEQETYFSAKIKLHQHAWADYLWRLFTIHDNIFVPHIEELLSGKVMHNPKTEHEEWRRLIAQHPELESYLRSKVLKNGSPLRWEEPNKFVYHQILRFFHERGEYLLTAELEDIHKNLLALGALRNAIAHNYKGINRQMIEEKLIGKTLPDGQPALEGFNRLLESYMGIAAEDFGIYPKVNQRILMEAR